MHTHARSWICRTIPGPQEEVLVIEDEQVPLGLVRVAGFAPLPTSSKSLRPPPESCLYPAPPPVRHYAVLPNEAMRDCALVWSVVKNRGVFLA